MSHLITLEDVSLSFGPVPLLDHVKFQISDGERVCLIGRNGAGKSSLLKVIEKTLHPTDGAVRHQPHLKLARLAQTLPDDPNQTVYEFVAEGLAKAGGILAAYHQLTCQLCDQPTEAELARLSELQSQMDTLEAWDIDLDITSMLTQFNLPADKKLLDLSGGWQRRAALARALVLKPDLLLLDEPTNHLDIEAIQWLEHFLLTSNLTLIFITHDRALLQHLATRIIELDRGQLTSWPGDYQNFLTRKAQMLDAENKLNALFDKKLAQEEVWIRQGIKARRTRNEGRVRALEALRLERTKRRHVEGQVKMQITEADQSGKLVIEAEHLTQHFHGQAIIQDFSIRIMRGDRIGLIGPNGIGKSTLLNLLLGKLKPEAGHVKQGTKLEIAYFDQRRSDLDLEKTAAENIGKGSEFVEIDGQKRHIVSYLNDFLFTPQRAMTPAKLLSGGECNRLLLACLFSRHSNFLILDEPTNDLDIETLELLEELLMNYKGTIVLVSHDRQFLNHVVSSTLVFEGKGKIQEYIGGYDDWLRQRPITLDQVTPQTKKPTAMKLTDSERNELKSIPKKIETLEAKINQLEAQIGATGFYDQHQAEIDHTLAALRETNLALSAAYDRWEKLERGEPK